MAIGWYERKGEKVNEEVRDGRITEKRGKFLPSKHRECFVPHAMSDTSCPNSSTTHVGSSPSSSAWSSRTSSFLSPVPQIHTALPFVDNVVGAVAVDVVMGDSLVLSNAGG